MEMRCQGILNTRTSGGTGKTAEGVFRVLEKHLQVEAHIFGALVKLWYYEADALVPCLFQSIAGKGAVDKADELAERRPAALFRGSA